MNMKGKDKKRLRFTYEDDVILLQEVVSRNPYANGCAVWEEVKNNLMQLIRKEFSVKTIRQHIQMLLDQWENKETNNQKSSGVEEPYSQKDVLLQELHDLIREIKIKNQKNATKVAKKKADTEIGKETREHIALQCMQSEEIITHFINEYDYMMNSDVIIENSEQHEFDGVEIVTENDNVEQAPVEELVFSTTDGKYPGKSIPKVKASINNSSNIIGPTKRRAKKTNYIRRSGLDYLKEKNNREMELEEKRLRIEERKIAVSERNVALAEKKFLFESEQYKNLFEKQQEVINKLIDIVGKYN